MSRPKRIIFLPVEAYRSRYTEYTSVKGGVYETLFQKNGIEFLTIRPTEKVFDVIKTGHVLDATARTMWGFVQVQTLINMISAGVVHPDEDVIYLEDFWTPGFEMIPYVQSLVFGNDIAKHVPVYSFCHAQSTDPHDFSSPWAWWMRDLERGWARYHDVIFCAAKEMIEQFQKGQLPSAKLGHIGHIWDGDVVQFQFSVPAPPVNVPREPWVVYSSRLDTEKNPLFFIEVAKRVMTLMPEVKFIICSGHEDLKTNSPEIKEKLVDFINDYPSNVQPELGLKKDEYFDILSHAKVQFNCASQDFISYTLLEASLYGCAPLYPRHLTFPDALNNSEKNLYTPGSVFSAADKMISLLKGDNEDYSWIHTKYQSSGQRLLYALGFDVCEPPSIDHLNGMTVEELKEYFAVGTVNV